MPSSALKAGTQPALLCHPVGDGHEGRNYVLSLGALDIVLGLLHHERSSQFRETLSWFVVNIFRDTESPPSDEVIQCTLPIVHMLMYEKISMVCSVCCRACRAVPESSLRWSLGLL